jgi:hypothetical protein
MTTTGVYLTMVLASVLGAAVNEIPVNTGWASRGTSLMRPDPSEAQWE